MIRLIPGFVTVLMVVGLAGAAYAGGGGGGGHDHGHGGIHIGIGGFGGGYEGGDDYYYYYRGPVCREVTDRFVRRDGGVVFRTHRVWDGE